MTKRKAKRRRRARDRRRRSRSWPYMLLGTLGLIAVAAVVWFVVVRPAQFQLTGPLSAVPPSDTNLDAGEIPYPEVPRVSVAEAKARYDAGTALFVDTRAREAYVTAHIPKAISLPITDLEAHYRELPQDVEILTY